jgi:hypothetical protein
LLSLWKTLFQRTEYGNFAAKEEAMTAPTLEGRLICACTCTYAVTMGGPLSLDAADVYAAGAGFVQPPAAFVGGDERINGCLVGTLPDGVVVAFRGTLSFDIHSHPTLLDWLGDFNAEPTPLDGFPGQVHGGFLAALGTLWDEVLAEVAAQRIGPAATQPLLVTGHSKGGALAALAAWRLQTAAGVPTKVVTFAAPKVGNRAFRDAYNAQMNHTRYEYADDIVPHLPASKGGFLEVLASLPVIGARFGGLQRFDYEPVGALRFIDWSGGFDDDTPTLTVERTLSLVRLITRQRFPQIAADHAIACGSGYMSAVCPTGVCPAPLP